MNLCYVKTAQTPFLTPMRRVGQTSEPPSVYAAFVDFCPIIPYSSILRTIPVAFIYKNSFVDLITFLLSVNKGVLYCKIFVLHEE